MTRRTDLVFCAGSSRAAREAMRNRRSFILLAVLVVMMSALLVATSLLFVAQTEAAGAAGAADAAQTRALLWSGAQVVMSRLHEQRERVLSGEAPVIEPQYVIYETSARAGVVRLLPGGRGAGALLEPESGKLDVNRIDAESLARTGLVDAAAASAIIAWRGRLGRPIQSIGELLAAPGVSVETLYGSIDALLLMDRALTDAPSSRSRGGASDLAGADDANAPARGLADVLTPFSFEPAVQRSGALRINLNVEWSDELGQRVEERFGAEAAALLRQIIESGTKFDREGAIVQTLRRFNAPLQDWPEILDAFTTESGPHHFGRLDLNTASREALLALDGVTEEQAAQIVSARGELSSEERATILWPALMQILRPEQYQALADRVTTRCWLWRVRIAAGEVDADAPDGPLINPMIQELVIDLSGPRPRIAYLRDVTLLQDAALLAAEASRNAESALDRWDPGAQLRSEVDEAGADRPAPEAAQSQPDGQPPRPAGRAPAPGRPSARGSGNGSDNATQPASPAASSGDGAAGQRIGRWRSG